MKKPVKKAIRKLIVAVIWLLIWEIAYLAVGQEVLIVSPAAVVVRVFELLGQGTFWLSVAGSMGRILLGFFIALAVGCVLGILTSFVPFMDDLFRPILSIIKATPVASFIILALVWLATGIVPVFTSFLMVLPVVWGNITQGIQATDRNLLEMAQVFRLSRGTTLRNIYLPSITPYFMAAATTGMGLAWKAGVAAEVLCRPDNSLGAALYDSKIYLETLDLFALTAVIIIMSILLEKLFVMLMGRMGQKVHVPLKQNSEVRDDGD